MKKVFFTALAVITCFTSVLFTSCVEEPCKKVVCAYSGTCEDGLCKCQAGYEGIHCETKMRDKFLGGWNVNEDGTLSSAVQYSATIEEGAKINEVLITNVQNVNTWKVNKVKGYIKGDSITIDSTPLPNGERVQGFGYIKSTNPLDQHYYQHATLEFHYSITNAIGQVNKYGFPDEGLPSKWSK